MSPPSVSDRNAAPLHSAHLGSHHPERELRPGRPHRHGPRAGQDCSGEFRLAPHGRRPGRQRQSPQDDAGRTESTDPHRERQGASVFAILEYGTGNEFLLTLFLTSSSSSGRGKGSRCASSVTTRIPAESSPPSCRSPWSARRCTDILPASNGRHLSQVAPAEDDCGTDEMYLGKEESFYTTHTGEKGGRKVLSLHGGKTCIEKGG